MASEMYWEFAQSIRGKLRDEVNGIVKFERLGRDRKKVSVYTVEQ